MRTDISAATLALQASGAFDAHWLIRVANGSGTLIDLSDRMGGIAGALPSPDGNVGTARIDFLRDLNDDPNTSLAPLIANDFNVLDDGTTFSALLQVGRVVVVSVALTARGGDRPVDADFDEVLRGRIRAVSWGGWYGGASIECLDDAGALQRTKSEAEYTHAAGTAMETAAQAVLTNNGFSSITLSVPAATSVVLPVDYKPGLQKSVWEQVQALAQACGFVCWYRYDAAGVAELVFFEPDRDKTDSDFTFNHIYEVNRFDVDEEEIGNVLYDQYTDSDGARQLTAAVVDADSITKYGGIRRSFWISEEKGSPVGDNATAVAMLTKILPDVADPDAIAEYKVPLFVFGEVSVDLYTFPADDRHYDTDQKLAPFQIRYEHQQGQLPISTIAVRGKPSGGSGAWKARRVPAYAVSEPVAVYSLIDFREVEASAAGKRRWGWTARGAKVDSVWYAAQAFTTPFDVADAWATVAGLVLPLPSDQDYVEIDVPAGDENVLLQVEPRLADLTVHDADVVERVQLYPVPTTLDITLSATIVSNLVDLSLTLKAGAGAMPYSATALVYEGDATGTLLASFTFTADGTKTKADDADMGGRALPAEGKKVWTVVVTDRTGTVRSEQVMVNAPRLPYFDGVRSVLSADLLSVDIYGTVTDPAGLGGTLEYWLPADESTATDPSGSATGSVVIAAGSMPYAMGPTGISDFNDVVTVGNAFSLVLKFTASDGRTTGKQAFPLAGSMQFLIDDLGLLRAESVHNGLVLASEYRPYYLGSGAPSLTVADYGTDRYFDTTALQPYSWNGSAWAEDNTTPAVSYAPILRAGVVTAEVLEATAVRAKLVGAERVQAENLVASLSLEVGQSIQSTTYTAGSAGWIIKADGSAEFTNVTVAGYAESGDLAGLSAIIRATSAPSTRSDGSALVAGDQWVDTDDGNRPYNWSGSAWVRAYTIIDGGDITTGTVLADRLQIGAGTTFATGYNPTTKVTTFAQTSAPTAVATGDLWIDTDDSNKLYRWSGSAWVAYRDGTIPSITGLSAILYATTAPTTRSGGSALVQGDQWIDTDDGNRPYIWSGSAWVASYTSIDGGSIKTGSIQSIVYTPGSAGWSIDTDGTAEFNDVTIRGTVEGSTIRIATGGGGSIAFEHSGVDFATLTAFDGSGTGEGQYVSVSGAVHIGTGLKVVSGGLVTSAGLTSLLGGLYVEGSAAEFFTNATNIGTKTGATIGFYGATAVTKPTVSGSRGGNAALASLMTALANLGLVTNSTS